MVVATDHDHYVNQETYSEDTKDFDFREGMGYVEGVELTYRTEKPYGNLITLANSYSFSWDKTADGLYFMKLAVEPRRAKENLSVE